MESLYDHFMRDLGACVGCAPTCRTELMGGTHYRFASVPRDSIIEVIERVIAVWRATGYGAPFGELVDGKGIKIPLESSLGALTQVIDVSRSGRGFSLDFYLRSGYVLK